jgi:hypothetical protein
MALHGIPLTDMAPSGMWTPLNATSPLEIDTVRGVRRFAKAGERVAPDIMHFTSMTGQLHVSAGVSKAGEGRLVGGNAVFESGLEALCDGVDEVADHLQPTLADGDGETHPAEDGQADGAAAVWRCRNRKADFHCASLAFAMRLRSR